MNILFIACYSPLINNSASIETLMYLNNLASIKDVKVTLLTVDFPKTSIYYDEEILKMLNKDVEIHKLSGGKLFNKIMPKKSIEPLEVKIDSNTKGNKKNNIQLLRKIKNKIIFPDMYYNWSKKASEYGINLVREKNIDIIFSMHEPPSSHLCALKIKKQFKNIPWITYWSDPWMKDSTREDIGFLRKSIEGNMERKVVDNSDKFIFVTRENAEDFKRTYNIDDKRVFLINRGYDEDTYIDLLKEDIPSKIKNDKINIVYAGEIFKKLRDINPFVDSIYWLKENEREIYNNLNILFFGNIDDEEAKEKLSSLENVEVSGRIPFKEALKYMLNSEILLIFGNKNSKQIPAKIYDYFGTDGFIEVILGDEKDPLRIITEGKEKCEVTINKKQYIVKSLKILIDKVLKGEKSKRLEEYEWKNVSKKLYSILKGE
ncbi:glycosyltransferase [Clostridium fallax]|uniref:Glycosyltransferase involved in cell wall bisynthesis n=1 Tax=Clostridium fallax TaxID=1533 RepID=A0A1M4WQJ1_9CLOT|nr:glycosyltransferase [Clostridium fallax]SHE83440.1 Glycosyltransferase involved in cell wall bisynthesis [Clostridium fallax]SQB06273.1 glycosyl transferases group 1 [Clostridium fallax]